jgi:hypothetical protein
MRYVTWSILSIVAIVFPYTLTFGQSTATTSPTTSEAVVVGPTVTREQIPGSDIQLGDFVVGPGKAEVVVKPGETVYKEITVTNRIDDNRSFQFHIEDMSGSADGREAVVLLGDQSGPYSLKDYVSVPESVISLKLGERARIPVKISMPLEAEPGGYYGAVLVSTIQDNAESDGAIAQSPIVARIGTLFFITVPGEATKESTLLSFGTQNDQWWFTKGPIELGVSYENKGSIHLNPYGEVRITNMLGNEVGYVELDPWFVLPKSIRTRDITWESEFLLGRYALTASINRGYENIIDSKTIYIWVIPWQLIVSVFAAIFGILFLFRWFFNKFELKRK